MVSKRPQQPLIVIKIFTPVDIKNGIEKLRRRIKDVEQLQGMQYDDAAKGIAERNIRDSVGEIFGLNSQEYRDYQYPEIYRGDHIMGMSVHAIQAGFQAGIPHMVKLLEGLIEKLREKEAELGPTQNEQPTFWDLLHPRIAQLARPRFESGHPADAVEASLKEINTVTKDLVKRKTGQEFDGSDLMNRAFSPTGPIISLDDLSTESGRNIQKGFMQIYAGAMTGIRNPKTHENVTITEQRAIHFLFLASLLMFKFDERLG